MGGYQNVRTWRDEHERCRRPDFMLEDWGSPGDIRLCPHGRLQVGFEVIGTIPCYWRDLSPVFNPILWRKARRLLAAPTTGGDSGDEGSEG